MCTVQNYSASHVALGNLLPSLLLKKNYFYYFCHLYNGQIRTVNKYKSITNTQFLSPRNTGLLYILLYFLTNWYSLFMCLHINGNMCTVKKKCFHSFNYLCTIVISQMDIKIIYFSPLTFLVMFSLLWTSHPPAWYHPAQLLCCKANCLTSACLTRVLWHLLAGQCRLHISLCISAMQPSTTYFFLRADCFPCPEAPDFL